MTQLTLALNKSIEQNAALYYDRAKKLKKKIEGAKAALDETKKKLDRLEEETAKAKAKAKSEEERKEGERQGIRQEAKEKKAGEGKIQNVRGIERSEIPLERTLCSHFFSKEMSKERVSSPHLVCNDTSFAKKTDGYLLRRNEGKKEWYEKFRWFISSEGFLVIGGRDAATNEIVVKKYTDKDDLVFHTDIIGSPFFVIKSGGRKPGEQTIREAADAAATFSKAWKLGMSNTSVFYCRAEQLSKEAPSGEYIPRGGFVTKGKLNYVENSISCGVGVYRGNTDDKDDHNKDNSNKDNSNKDNSNKDNNDRDNNDRDNNDRDNNDRDNNNKIMSGPLAPIKKSCESYVEIEQGREKASKVAKYIQSKIGGDIDDIIRVLPGGGCKIKRY